jgi:peptidoglycan/LPS O-acetylase OafA/YrhL
MKKTSLPVDPAAGAIPASFSLYLDLLRFAAALAVFFSHLSIVPFTKNVLWWRLGQYSDAAVIVFFVMSGYVIAFVSSGREKKTGSYFGSRVSRLYSIVLVALPITFLFDTIGANLHPDFYGMEKVLWKPQSWTGYISSFFFVNEYQVFGFNGISPGTNGPFWSLSFEATYYLLAGIFLFSRRIFWMPTALLILALAGKTVAALLPVWILGYALYKINASKFKSTPIIGVAFFGSAFLLIYSPAIEAYLPNYGDRFSMPWGRGPFNRNLVNDYFIAATFGAHLVSGRILLANGFNLIERLSAPIRWLGSLTFPLYSFHYPAICLFSAISPWGITSMYRPVFVSAMTGLLVIVLTPVCDKLKISIRKNYGLIVATTADLPSKWRKRHRA